MAKDIREIVYYKGKEYYLEKKGENMSTLELVSSKSVSVIAMNDKILTKKQYLQSLENKPFGYINHTI